MLHRIAKHTQVPFISPLHPACRVLKDQYIHILNFNALLYIIVHYRLTELTLFDPEGSYAYRLSTLLTHLKFLRVITQRDELYQQYNEGCFDMLGVSAAITDDISFLNCDIVFAAAPLPKNIIRSNFFLLGQGGFSACIDELFVPEAQALCPAGIGRADFFTMLAMVNGFTPLLKAVPKILKNGDTVTDIEKLPIKSKKRA